MKKIVLIVALIAIIGVGTTFAGEYPNGFGIGIFGQYGFGDIGGTGGGLAIKLPGVPVFWGLNVGLDSGTDWSYLGFGLIGDFHFIENSLGGNLNWWLGIGGLFRMDLYSQTFRYASNSDTADYNYINIAARIPVGVNITFSTFDLYFQAVATLGARLYSGYDFTLWGIQFKEDSTVGFGWGVPLELGIRFWL